MVPGAFIFGVGDVIVPDDVVPNGPSELIFLLESRSKISRTCWTNYCIRSCNCFSNYLGYAKQKSNQREELEKVQKFHHSKFMSVTGIGLMLVFISDVLMIAVQTIKIKTSPIDVIQNTLEQFGLQE